MPTNMMPDMRSMFTLIWSKLHELLQWVYACLIGVTNSLHIPEAFALWAAWVALGVLGSFVFIYTYEYRVIYRYILSWKTAMFDEHGEKARFFGLLREYFFGAEDLHFYSEKRNVLVAFLIIPFGVFGLCFAIWVLISDIQSERLTKKILLRQRMLFESSGPAPLRIDDIREAL